MNTQVLLKSAYSQNPKLLPQEIDQLLALALHKKPEYIYKNQDKELLLPAIKKFNKLLRRKQQNYPLAYLRGYQEFYGLKFLVNKNVLIPRPESELLVEQALKFIKKIKNPKIIDLGTGSGCLIIALAKNNPRPAEYLATDISIKALRTAKTNSRRLGLKNKIKFIKSNLLNKIPQQKFDLIIANLPYLTFQQLKKPSIQQEPRQALLAGKDGLKYYQKLLKKLPAYLAEKYLILLEIDPKQKNQLESLIQQSLPNSKIQFLKDLAGNIRVIKIFK